MNLSKLKSKKRIVKFYYADSDYTSYYSSKQKKLCKIRLDWYKSDEVFIDQIIRERKRTLGYKYLTILKHTLSSSYACIGSVHSIYYNNTLFMTKNYV